MHFHIGAWKALKEEDKFLKQIKSIGGASSGCFVAFLLASGVSEVSIIEKFDKFSQSYPGFQSLGSWSAHVNNALDEHLFEENIWLFEPYAVITTIEKYLPFVGPRFITIDNKKDIKTIKSLIMSSCYIPFIYEKVPKWNGKFVLDGGLFLMNLTIPNTLTISPYMKSDKNVIGYEEGSDEERILKERKLGSLIPNETHLKAVTNCGYSSAKKWLEKYNKEI